MNSKARKIYLNLKKNGLDSNVEEYILKELEYKGRHVIKKPIKPDIKGFYDWHDLVVLQKFSDNDEENHILRLKTLEDLLEQDKQREKDGFPRRIRLGKLTKPGRGSKSGVIVVPTTHEPKFLHDDSITEDGEGEPTGGTGDEQEGEVIGQQPVQPQSEGEGQGAGQGEGAEHAEETKAFDLGKLLTEKFELPNIKEKGKKPSLTKYTYDLTDKNRGFGQLLDKKSTLKKIVETNILLGNIDPSKPFDTTKFIIGPKDHVYRIMSREKDYENQAVVFFIRDYSGSMQGKPTDVVCTQHLFIYSWLMYQYQNNVKTRFILHDTEAKEVTDFYTYYRLQVAGGTQIFPAFRLMNKIIESEKLYVENNIYVFYGTDGDDWESDGKQMIEELKKTLTYSNRTGITVAKNSWTGESPTTIEKYLEASGLLKEKKDLLRLDSFIAAQADDDRIIQSIKKLIS